MSTPIIQVSVLPAAPVLNVSVVPSSGTIVSKLLTGARGSDASVTSANIAAALGYTPADAAHLGTASTQDSSAFDAAGAASTALATATTRAIAFSIAL